MSQSGVASNTIGGGNVVGPASSINGDIVVFNGTTGKIIADSGATYGSGTFTPVLAIGGSTTGFAYSTQIGKYTQIGNQVFIQIDITLSNTGSGTGTYTLSGLPVTSGNISTTGHSIIPLIQFIPTAADNTSHALSVDTSSTIGTFIAMTQTNGASGSMTTTNVTFSNTTTMRLQGFYFTS